MKFLIKIMIVIFMVTFSFVFVSNNVYAIPDDYLNYSDSSSNSGVSSANNDLCSLVPDQISNIIASIVNIIKIGVLIILIVLGMIDMGKAVASQKEDDIKKGQKTLISRCIAAGIVFFVVAIVQLLVGIIEGNTSDPNSIWSCVSKLIGVDTK